MARTLEALDPSIWHPELLAGPLRSKRLTVLYGAPGALRDGMLRRGLMPLLRQQPAPSRTGQRRREVPIRFDGWGPLPLQALRTRIDAEFTAVWPEGAPETLAAHLTAIGRQHHATVLLVLDAFERHLGERAERHDIERFDAELSECVTNETVPLHVLMVVDELENRALQRYTRWIADFGDNTLRLPALVGGNVDATAWRDTDIQAPPEEDADDPAAADDEADWPVDLLLELDESGQAPTPPPAPATPAPMTRTPRLSAAPHRAAPPPAATPPAAPPRAATPLPPTPSAPAPPAAAPPVAAPAPPHGPARTDPLSFTAFDALSRSEARRWEGMRNEATRSHAARDDTASNLGRTGSTRERLEPTFTTEAPTPAPPTSPPPGASRMPPAAAPPAPEPPFGTWPPIPPAAAAPRSVPPWLSAADIEQMRRAHEPTSRWPALLGLALYMVLLFAGAWWVARWIIDSQRVEQRPRPPVSAPSTQAPAVPPAVNPTPARSTAPQAAAPAAPPAAPPNTLTVALPPDAGSAAPLLDQLIQRVAAPAGLQLRTATASQPATLALMRTDALLAPPAANAPPLQVVAPLYYEQIQVLVRTGSRWDYVREIKGLRLNIGPANGARARTVRALYQQMFGTPLPPEQANELEIDAALGALQQRGGPIDAVIVISDVPLEPRLEPAARRRVRELSIDARQMRTVTSLPAFSISRRTPQDRARLSVATYLVALGAPPQPHDAALRKLAVALCRAQPALQAQNSLLLRGWRQGQQPDVGWPYLLPRTPNAVCPAA